MNQIWTLVAVLMVLVVLAEGLAILGLARAVGAIQLRLGREAPALQTPEGLAVGTLAPDISGYELWAKRLETRTVSRGRWALVFLTPTCSVCRTLAKELGYVGRGRDGAAVVLVAHGQHDQNAIFRAPVPHLVTFSDPNGDMHRAYGVEQVPYAFIVQDGRIAAKGLINSKDQLEMLIERVGETPATDTPLALAGAPQIDVPPSLAKS